MAQRFQPLTQELPPTTGEAEPEQEAEASDAPRIAIETEKLSGSISLLGGRLDDLSLKDYPIELDAEEVVRLLSPVGTDNAYYALYGWAAAQGVAADAVPGPNTLWTVEKRRQRSTPRTRSRWLGTMVQA